MEREIDNLKSLQEGSERTLEMSSYMNDQAALVLFTDVIWFHAFSVAACILKNPTVRLWHDCADKQAGHLTRHGAKHFERAVARFFWLCMAFNQLFDGVLFDGEKLLVTPKYIAAGVIGMALHDVGLGFIAPGAAHADDGHAELGAQKIAEFCEKAALPQFVSDLAVAIGRHHRSDSILLGLVFEVIIAIGVLADKGVDGRKRLRRAVQASIENHRANGTVAEFKRLRSDALHDLANWVEEPQPKYKLKLSKERGQLVLSLIYRTGYFPDVLSVEEYFDYNVRGKRFCACAGALAIIAAYVAKRTGMPVESRFFVQLAEDLGNGSTSEIQYEVTMKDGVDMTPIAVMTETNTTNEK